eukprot:3953170-Pleurochrysis_carterae.AAC.1
MRSLSLVESSTCQLLPSMAFAVAREKRRGNVKVPRVCRLRHKISNEARGGQRRHTRHRLRGGVAGGELMCVGAGGAPLQCVGGSHSAPELSGEGAYSPKGQLPSVGAHVIPKVTVCVRVAFGS